MTALKPPEPTQVPKSRNTNSLSDSIKLAQTVISLVVGSVALLTAGGFIVVNTYLSIYTQALSQNVTPSQYIVGGIILALIGFVLIAIWYALGRPAKNWLAGRHKIFAGRPDIVIVAWIISYLILGGLIVGTYIYAQIPRSLAGGRPTKVILTFGKDVTPSDVGLTADPNNAHWSLKVNLLAYLDDGVLVLDLYNGHVVAVKNSSLNGLIEGDNQPLVENALAQATLTAMPLQTAEFQETETQVP